MLTVTPLPLSRLALKSQELHIKRKKKYTESIVKSQNIVEQANSNPNNISPTMSRRHIICKSSSVAEMNQKFHS